MDSRAGHRSRSPTRALDFLGYRALRDLLGSLGKSSLGRHDTREHGHRHRGQRRAEAVRVRRHDEPRRERHDPERGAARSARRARVERSRDPTPTLDAALGSASGIDVDYEDLMVAQGEYQSSCATVLMLDCSHSMILYGEDRFTPAKRVALALAQLIQTAVPGRRAEGRALPRLGGGDSARPSSAASASARTTPTRAKGCGWRAASSSGSEGHAADHHDHRRQAVGADPARRPHLQERLRPRPVHRRRDVRRSRGLPQEPAS